jgi:hypothetical protein
MSYGLAGLRFGSGPSMGINWSQKEKKEDISNE